MEYFWYYVLVVLAALVAAGILWVTCREEIKNWLGLNKKQASAKEPERPTPAPVKAEAPVRPVAKAPADVKTFNVVGANYRMDEVMALAVKNEAYNYTKKQLVDEDIIERRIYEYEFFPHKFELIPEPTNPQDPNAIMVVADGHHVGYIKEGACAQVRNLINSGRIESITGKIYGGKYKLLAEDFDENGDPHYSFEHDEVGIRVTVDVHLA